MRDNRNGSRSGAPSPHIKKVSLVEAFLLLLLDILKTVTHEK